MSYRVWIDSAAIAETDSVPGHMRQILKRAMKALASDPRPSDSKELDWPPERLQPRRIKIRNWRIIYAVHDADRWVWVLAIRKRPPYDCGDLVELLRRLK